MRTIHESRERMDGNINPATAWADLSIYSGKTEPFTAADVSRLLGDQRVSFNLTADVPAPAICHDHETVVHG